MLLILVKQGKQKRLSLRFGLLGQAYIQEYNLDFSKGEQATTDKLQYSIPECAECILNITTEHAHSAIYNIIAGYQNSAYIFDFWLLLFQGATEHAHSAIFSIFAGYQNCSTKGNKHLWLLGY